jgi:hypothetical protein
LGPTPWNLLGLQVDVHERNHEQEQRHLHDRLRRIVHRAGRHRLRQRSPQSLKEAEVHPYAARGARHGQVDELDRRLQHDAGEERQRGHDGAADRDAGGDELIDSYHTSRTRYREIACLVAGTRTSSVLVGAAPSKTWTQQAKTIERAIASLRTD